MDEKNKDKIKKWKDRYSSIFSVIVNNQEYIYRTFTVDECEKVFDYFIRNDGVGAEDIALGAILYPEDFNPDDLTISVAQKLSKYIIHSSKIFEPDGLFELVKDAKEKLETNLKNDIFQWKLSLMNIFKGYTMPALNKLSIPELFDLLVLAEHLTGEKLINYTNIKQNELDQNKLNKIDTSNVASNGKFMSKSQLDEVAADQATSSLKTHWIKHKK